MFKTYNCMNTEPPWWKDGIRFQCQGSGKCCVSRGRYGYVYLTLEDRRRFAKHFGVPTGVFTRRYCEKTDGYFHLKEFKKRAACLFLDGQACSVYEARPTQCRTWPFWPENMKPRSWSRAVKTYCPGVDKGEIVSADRIREILKEQSNSENAL